MEVTVFSSPIQDILNIKHHNLNHLLVEKANMCIRNRPNASLLDKLLEERGLNEFVKEFCLLLLLLVGKESIGIENVVHVEG